MAFSSIKKLTKNAGFVRYFKNTSWLVFEKAFRLIISLTVGVWVARYLGPGDFGIYSFANSVVGILVIFSYLGLNSVSVRELVKEEHEIRVLLGTTFALKFLGSSLLVFVLFIIWKLSSADLIANLLILIIATKMVFQSFNVIDFYFQSKVLSKYTVFSNLIGLILSSGIKVILIATKASLVAFALTLVLESFLVMIGLNYFYSIRAPLSIFKWKFNKQLAITLLKDCWPLILSTIILSIYMRIDQIMIMYILDSESVGIYAAAAKIGNAWNFIPMVIVSSLYPSIVNAKKKSEELYMRRLQSLYDLMVWISISIALVITFSSDWLIETLYGIEFIEASQILKIHIWTTLFVFIGVVYSRYLVTENLTKKVFYRNCLGAIINILLNLILIPKMGIIGAAIATFLGQFSANYIYDLLDVSQWGQLKMKTKSFFPIHQLKRRF